jgi:tungstate transport system substrate-binding protein
MRTVEGRIPYTLALLGLLVVAAAVACARPGVESTPTLRLGTTTSAADSGLLSAILPDFEERYDVKVNVSAVGTGQALTLGEQGDVDVVLVHARRQEDRFVEQGFGINRQHVMFSDFIIVGPDADPANVRNAGTAVEAFAWIADTRVAFISRGDQSGTHSKEREIWDAAGTAPAPLTGWYQALGQGMGETLAFANGESAYTITDRATYTSMQDELPNLVILFGGESMDQNPDLSLHNPYSVIQVNPERHPGVNAELAAAFVEWITSADGQASIADYGLEEHGQPLFVPPAAP